MKTAMLPGFLRRNWDKRQMVKLLLFLTYSYSFRSFLILCGLFEGYGSEVFGIFYRQWEEVSKTLWGLIKKLGEKITAKEFEIEF